RIRWLPSVGALAFAARVSLHSLLAHPDPPEVLGEHIAWFALTSLVMLGTVHALTRSRHGPVPLLLLCLLTGAASHVLVLSFHSQNQGQVVGMRTALLTSALLVSLWRRNLSIGTGGTTFAVLLTLTAMLQCRLYGPTATPEIGRFYAHLLVLAPLLGWFA